MKAVLAGNPNCGKTTLFNKLTGSHLDTGNRAGVTVEEAEGRRGEDYIYDLPGIYSLNRPSNEEKAADDFLRKENVDLIINVADVRYLERSLFLTTQLLEKRKPTVLALNMCDEAKKLGLDVDCEALSRSLGCKVVRISAKKDKNFDELFSSRPLPSEKIFPSDASSRYAECEKISSRCVKRNGKTSFSEKADDILLGKYTAFPIFFAVMFAVLFLCSFLGDLAGKAFSAATEYLFAKINAFLSARLSPSLASLIGDGVLTGVGSVAEFLPVTVITFFFLALLEESGYLARIAFLADRPFASAGLSGRTAISLIVACGCTASAAASTRTIPDDAEREKCLCSLHFMPCSAKLPLFATFVNAFFPGNYFALPLLYVTGVFCVFCLNILLPGRKMQDFIMEIPARKFPSVSGVLGKTAAFSRSFFRRTCAVVFVASIVVWVLINYNFGFRKCDIEDSMLAVTSEMAKYLFYPVGLTDKWHAAAIAAGFAGKETVLGVLGVITKGDLPSLFTPSSALSFCLFILLSPPCAASCSALKKELGGKKFLRCLGLQFLFAYVFCAAFHAISLLIGTVFR